MNMNKKIKFILTLILLITAMSFMGGCRSKTSVKDEGTALQTGQNGSSSTDDKEDDSTASGDVSMEDWKFDVPKGFEIEENGGPWYEKRYANENGVVLLFGYYAPNGIDNRTDKQIFEEQRDNEKQDLISKYGNGEIEYKEINSDKLYMTTYYETRDLKVLKRSKVQNRVWKIIYVQVPISENEEDYEYILDIIEQ